MVLNEQIIKQAAKIKPFEVCYVRTSTRRDNIATRVHVCLVNLYDDGYIMLLDEGQMVIDYAGKIIELRPLADGENLAMGSYPASARRLPS